MTANTKWAALTEPVTAATAAAVTTNADKQPTFQVRCRVKLSTLHIRALTFRWVVLRGAGRALGRTRRGRSTAASTTRRSAGSWRRAAAAGSRVGFATTRPRTTRSTATPSRPCAACSARRCSRSGLCAPRVTRRYVVAATATTRRSLSIFPLKRMRNPHGFTLTADGALLLRRMPPV